MAEQYVIEMVWSYEGKEISRRSPQYIWGHNNAVNKAKRDAMIHRGSKNLCTVRAYKVRTGSLVCQWDNRE